LDLTFESAQSVFQRFAFFHPNFSQNKLHLPTYLVGHQSFAASFPQVKGKLTKIDRKPQFYDAKSCTLS
jgi:hypothetical protein